jgi:hypothetical protein
MSIDSQTLNLTGSLKVSGDVKTNVSSKLGVGTDAPQATVHVSNLHPKVLLEETGAALSSAALLYANNHALNIQVGQEAAADSKANVVFSSYGGQTEHLRIIGSENKVHVPNVLEVSNVEVSNLQATNLAVNVLTIEELTLGVIASLDTVLNTNNQTTNTITTSNVTDSVSTATGAVVINAGGLGVKSNIHATNVYAETVTANVAANSVQATSNVTAPNVYVTGMPLATVGSNLVTWDSSTGQLIDSGGLFSNKLSVVSEHPPEAMTSNTVTVTDHGVYRVRSSGQYSTNVDYSAFNKSTGTYWVSPSGYTGASNVYSASTQLSSASSTALGEWISMEIPYKVKLRYVRLSQGLNAESFPTDAKLYGSTDNNAWTEIKAWAGATAEDTHLVNATTAYNYFALVTTKVAGDYDKTSVGDIKLFCESFSVDGGKVEMPTSTKLSDGSSFIEQTKSKKLIKYPRVAMTANSSGGYSIVQSTKSIWPQETRKAWSLFNNVISGDGDTYHGSDNSSPDPYNSSNGTYQEDESLGGVSGTWLYIQLPSKISLHQVKIISRAGLPKRVPRSATFLGSNNGTDWTQLYSFSDVTLNSSSGTHIYTYDVNSNVDYQYFGFVWQKIGLDQYVNIDELELFGIPEYDPEADGTDVIVKSVPNVPNTDWLEVYWDGQDYTSMPGTVTDKTDNRNDGTPSGDVGFDTEYKAFTFDGSGDYISGTHGVGTGQPVHSQSVWFKLSGTTGDYQYISVIGTTSANQQAGLIIKDDGTTLLGSFYGGDRTITQITQSRWYHAVLVYPGGPTDNAKYYVNGVELPTTGTSGTPSLTGTNVYLGANTVGTQSLKGSIANFRLFNRALTGDEVWQLYAYQKEYFNVSPDVVTFKGGRLGIGTSEPRAPLDVMGIPYGPGARPIFFATNDANTTDTVSAAGIFIDDLPDAHVNVGDCYDGTTGRFTATIAGFYMFVFNINVISRISERHFCQSTFYLNGTNVNRVSTTRGLGYMVHQAVEDSDGELLSMEISRPFYLNVGDYVQVGIAAITSAEVVITRNYAWFTGYLLS